MDTAPEADPTRAAVRLELLSERMNPSAFTSHAAREVEMEEFRRGDA